MKLEGGISYGAVTLALTVGVLDDSVISCPNMAGIFLSNIIHNSLATLQRPKMITNFN